MDIQHFVLVFPAEFSHRSQNTSDNKFKCDLCDAGYVGFTRRHLHQRADEDKSSSSSIGKHFRDKHSFVPKDLTKNFSVLMKCANKFDCLVYEMFFINELKPSLNVQSDSIRAKVFSFLISFLLVFSFYVFIVYLHLLKIFLKLKIFKILNTSYVHISIYIYLPLYFFT